MTKHTKLGMTYADIHRVTGQASLILDELADDTRDSHADPETGTCDADTQEHIDELRSVARELQALATAAFALSPAAYRLEALREAWVSEGAA